MTVNAILNAKGHKIVTVKPTPSLSRGEAARRTSASAPGGDRRAIA